MSVGSVSVAPSWASVSPPPSDAEALHIDAWLDAIKPGYGNRFLSAFEQLGIEDAADVANIDHHFYLSLQAALQEAGAKPMHLKNIRLALLDMGCQLQDQGDPPARPHSPAAQRQDLQRTKHDTPGRALPRRPAARASVAAAEAAVLKAGGGDAHPIPKARRSHDEHSNGSFSGASSFEDDDDPLHSGMVPLSDAGSNPGGVAFFGLPVHSNSAPPLPLSGGAAEATAASDPSPQPVVGLAQKPPLPRSDSGFARALQFEEYKLSVSAAAAKATQAAQAAQAAAQAADGGGLWHKLARGIETEAELQQFFARRQSNSKGGRVLAIQSAVKVVNNACLHAFASAHKADINALKASKSKADSYLFHGCSQTSATNIQADGLRIGFAANGMLGRGLYGAPDPRKSLQYCKNSENGKFMFVCRFNLSAAKRAGPDTNHRNTIFDEFCVYDDRHVVVLWMLKLV